MFSCESFPVLDPVMESTCQHCRAPIYVCDSTLAAGCCEQHCRIASETLARHWHEIRKLNLKGSENGL